MTEELNLTGRNVGEKKLTRRLKKKKKRRRNFNLVRGLFGSDLKKRKQI